MLLQQKQILERKVMQMDFECKRYREECTKNVKIVASLRNDTFHARSKVATKAIKTKLEEKSKARCFRHWLRLMPQPASKKDALTNELAEAKLKQVCNQMYRVIHGYCSGENIQKAETLRWWWAQVILKRRIQETHFLKNYDLKTQLQLSYYVEICNDIAKSYDKLDIVSLLKTIRQSSERIAQAEQCSIFLVNKDGDLELAASEHEIEAKLHEKGNGAGVRIKKSDKSVLSYVATNLKTMIVEDVTKSALYNPAVDRMRAGRSGNVKSIMCIPMFAMVDVDEEFIKDCFNRYDVDESGNVDFTELKLVFGALEMEFNDDDIYKLLQLVKKDDLPRHLVDVTYEEFRVMLSASGKREMVAVLHLVNKLEARGPSFTEDDLDNMQVICKQAPMAIRTCLKSEEQARMLEQFRAMNEMTRLEQESIDTIALTATIVSLIQAERGNFYLKDPKRPELNYESVDIEGKRRHLHIPLDHTSIPGDVAMSKTIANIPDAYVDPRFNKQQDRARQGNATRSVLCVPVVAVDGAVLGVIEVMNRTDQFGVIRLFTRDDEEVLHAFGVCIENAIQKETARLQIESMSNTIVKQISVGKRLCSESEYLSTVGAFLGSVQSTCKADHAAVYIMDQKRREMIRYTAPSEFAVDQCRVPLIENSYIGVS